MTADDEPAPKKGARVAVRNRKIALDYVDALRNGNRAAVESALSPNF